MLAYALVPLVERLALNRFVSDLDIRSRFLAASRLRSSHSRSAHVAAARVHGGLRLVDLLFGIDRAAPGVRPTGRSLFDSKLGTVPILTVIAFTLARFHLRKPPLVALPATVAATPEEPRATTPT